MIILKSTILLFGLVSPSSITMDHTVVPSMSECRAYLAIEEDRLRQVDESKNVKRTDDSLSFKATKLGVTVSYSYECIDVKLE